jgi:hypothetical protein
VAVSLPEARDLSAADIVPTQILRDSTADLDDRRTLDLRFEEDGYLFFRGLIEPAAIEAARRRMLAPFVARGLVAADDDEAVWIGGDAPGLPETSPEFKGICRELFEWPGVATAFERLLGEKICTVPMVQYRAYQPNHPLGGVHQDGFYSPGILDYRPVWIPLIETDAAMGGLTLAAGMTRQGFFHNLAKPPRSPIPVGIIPDHAWSWAPYRPGDVVVIHPNTPHVGLPNRSNRMRLSLDTRVQAAARPSVIVGTLVGLGVDAITLRLDDGALETLAIDDETFIRTEHAARRMSRAEFAERTSPGLRLLASRDGSRAMMLRRPDEG